MVGLKPRNLLIDRLLVWPDKALVANPVRVVKLALEELDKNGHPAVVGKRVPVEVRELLEGEGPL